MHWAKRNMAFHTGNPNNFTFHIPYSTELFYYYDPEQSCNRICSKTSKIETAQSSFEADESWRDLNATTVFRVNELTESMLCDRSILANI